MSARTDGKKRADYIRGEERAWFPVLDARSELGLTHLFVERGVEPGVAYRMASFVRAHRELVDDGFDQSTRARIRSRLRALGPPTRAEELPSRIAIPG